ncbi:MAG: zinc ribbon domain-containing protein [Candidatus Lokiarchaeota archaeon]|nr:zinc ribbon domain-containing protein [Candidatus Lokiarchaeota archaeon]
MPQNSFPFDIFGFITNFFILIFVVVIIVFIIIIIVVYKLLHSNVDHVSKTTTKMPKLRTENTVTTFVKTDKGNLTKNKSSSKCKYCGEEIEEDIKFCSFCGANLTE